MLLTLRNLFGPDNRNSLWAITEYIWYPFLLFLSTRYFLEYLGNQKYGTWMFLNATVATSSILNVGINGAVIKVVSAEIGRGNAKLGRIADSALGIALSSGVLTASIMLVIVLVGWRDEALTASELHATAAAATILVFLEYIDAAFASMLKGGEHFRETARIEMLFKTAQMVLALVAVVLWADLVLLYAVLIVVNIARVVTKMLRVKRAYGIERIRPSFGAFSELIVYAKWGWLHGIGGFLLGVVDRLIVGYTLGSEALAYYALLLMFPQQIHALTAAAVSVTFPRVSSLLSSNRVDEVKVLRAKIARITTVAAAVAAIVLIVFPDEIFHLWLGKILPPEAMSALTPLSVSFFLLCVNVPPYYTLLGMGEVRYVAIVNLIAGIASVTVLISLLGMGGLYVAAVSKGVYAAILLVQFYRVNQCMNQLMRGGGR